MRIIAFVVILALTGSAEAALAAKADEAALAAKADHIERQEADAWRRVAESIPLGSKVKVETFEGKRFNGTLMRVDGNQILVKRNTRRPEPAVAVMFDDVSKLERDQKGGSNLAKAAVIGLATGAGVIFSLFLIALQFD
jgi:small nuclear ribonucleoprotein (snRNP)-like protein